jgi:tRNA(Ile)-lysidine synthase
VLQLQLRALGVEAEFDLVERLRTAPDQPLAAPGGLRLWRRADGRVESGPAESAGFGSAQARLSLESPAGTGEFAGLRLGWRRRARRPGRPPRITPRPGREWLDADQVGPVVVLRHWRPGDRFQPLGLPAPAKLQDLFTNAKIPRAERHRRVVAVRTDGTIFWVEGLRPGEVVRVVSATRHVLEWRWERPAADPATRRGGHGCTGQ